MSDQLPSQILFDLYKSSTIFMNIVTIILISQELLTKYIWSWARHMAVSETLNF